MGEAIDALGINGPQLLAQMANFIVLLVVLRFTLYKPILNMLDDRKARIAEGLGAADKARDEATAAQERIEEQIQQARQDGQEVVANAQQIAARIQQDAREQAERDRESFAERARQEIQLERDRAVSDLRAEFADITVSAAEKVIGESIDAGAHQRPVDDALTREQQPKGERAKDLVHPVGRDKHQHEKPQSRRLGDLCHVEGDGIADDEIEDRNHDRHPDRQRERLQVRRVP